MDQGDIHHMLLPSMFELQKCLITLQPVFITVYQMEYFYKRGFKIGSN